MVVSVQSFQALVAVEVPQLDRHVRAAARQHLTLLVQTHILKIPNNYTVHTKAVSNNYNHVNKDQGLLLGEREGGRSMFQ